MIIPARACKTEEPVEMNVSHVVVSLSATTSLLVLLGAAFVAASSFLEFAWFMRNTFETFIIVAAILSVLLLLAQYLKHKRIRISQVRW